MMIDYFFPVISWMVKSDAVRNSCSCRPNVSGCANRCLKNRLNKPLLPPIPRIFIKELKHFIRPVILNACADLRISQL